MFIVSLGPHLTVTVTTHSHGAPLGHDVTNYVTKQGEIKRQYDILPPVRQLTGTLRHQNVCYRCVSRTVIACHRGHMVTVCDVHALARLPSATLLMTYHHPLPSQPSFPFAIYPDWYPPMHHPDTHFVPFLLSHLSTPTLRIMLKPKPQKRTKKKFLFYFKHPPLLTFLRIPQRVTFLLRSTYLHI